MLSCKNSVMLSQAKSARFQPKLILQILLFFAVFGVGSSAASFVLTIPTVAAIFTSEEVMSSIFAYDFEGTIVAAMELINLPWLMLLSLFATACTTVLCIVYCTKIERRSLRSMGFVKQGFLLNYLKGFVIGTAMLFVCAAIAWALGALDFSFAKKIPVFYIFAFLLGFLIQGMSEEVLLRGFFMVSLANRCHVALAVTISSIAFSLLHLMNPGITLLALVNIGLFGGFMGVYVLRTDDLWGACAIHSAWNFVQGNILGIQVSGTGQLPTVAVMRPVSGMDLLSGGRFGLEAGLIVTIVTAAAICLTLFLPRKKEQTEAQVL